ncbi:MAG: cysteine hydrolase [Rhodoferax sp.]|nr:cysteine hydrolase [Rhodoferax sp.]
MKTAVLVIDVQQGLCQGAGAAFDCAGTIARINTVTRKARAAAVPVIFIQHESSTGYLEYGSVDWRLAAGLDVEPGDLKIRKTTPDAFLRTGLQACLQGLGVERVAICGMHSEFCVDSTTRSALGLGMPVLLVADAHTSAGNSVISAQQVIAHHNIALSQMASFGVRAKAIDSATLEFGG